jgi:hypothetical protein
MRSAHSESIHPEDLYPTSASFLLLTSRDGDSYFGCISHFGTLSQVSISVKSRPRNETSDAQSVLYKYLPGSDLAPHPTKRYAYFPTFISRWSLCCISYFGTLTRDHDSDSGFEFNQVHWIGLVPGLKRRHPSRYIRNTPLPHVSLLLAISVS